MREATFKDLLELEKHILAEGFESTNLYVVGAKTYIDDDGFFTYRINDGYPYIMHFWIKPELRGSGRGKVLIGKFLDMCRENGYKHAIISTPSDRKNIGEMVCYYFKVKKPYYTANNKDFYFVEV